MSKKSDLLNIYDNFSKLFLVLKNVYSGKIRILYFFLLALLSVALVDILGLFLISELLMKILGTQKDQTHYSVSISSFKGLLEFFKVQSTTSLAVLSAIILVSKNVFALTINYIFYLSVANKSLLLSEIMIRNFSKLRANQLSKIEDNRIGFAFTDAMNTTGISLIVNLIGLITDLLLTFLILFFVFIVNWKVAILLVSLMLVFSLIIQSRIVERVRSLSELQGEYQILNRKHILDFKYTIPELSDIASVHFFENRYLALRKEIVRIYAKVEWLLGSPKFLLELFSILVTLLISVIIYIFNPYGNNLATLGIVLVALFRLIPALLRVQSNWLSIHRSLGYFSNVRDIFQLLAEKELSNQEIRFQANKSVDKIIIQNLNFNYEDNVILQDINIEFENGKIYALIGDSGSGKSTLAKVILGLLHPLDGSVTYGTDLIKNNLLNYAYVPQTPYIFNGTLAENICLQKSDLMEVSHINDSFFELIGISEIANLYAQRFNYAYNTNGSELSGGQKQRIAVARAMLIKPKILVLDEFSSALDALAAKELTKLLLEDKNERITIIITHSYQTLGNCDYIIYLENGRVEVYDSIDVLLEKVPKFSIQSSIQNID